jgi:hypothetical protein
LESYIKKLFLEFQGTAFFLYHPPTYKKSLLFFNVQPNQPRPNQAACTQQRSETHQQAQPNCEAKRARSFGRQEQVLFGRPKAKLSVFLHLINPFHWPTKCSHKLSFKQQALPNSKAKLARSFGR